VDWARARDTPPRSSATAATSLQPDFLRDNLFSDFRGRGQEPRGISQGSCAEGAIANRYEVAVHFIGKT
jgi:hypothetical protein